METKKAIQTLNELLEDEISAVQIYEQVARQSDDDGNISNLRHIQYDHKEAVQSLHRHVTKLGGEPLTFDELWRVKSKAVKTAAAAFGQKAALRALKEEEEYAIREYREALEEENFPSECKRLIRNVILPRQHEHLEYLNGLLEAA